MTCTSKDNKCEDTVIFKAGQSWKTRDGRVVKILSTEAIGLCPIVGQLSDGLIASWHGNGIYTNGPHTHYFDLVEEVKPLLSKTLYIHLYAGHNDDCGVYMSSVGVPKDIDVAVKKVTITEGEGMDTSTDKS